MFEPLTPTEVVAAIGAAARAAARSEDPGDPFSRGQLRSADSCARHLAVELEHFDAERRTLADAVGGDLPTADGALADALCALLERLRADPSPEAAARRAQVQRALAAMADREVALLAAAIER